MDIESNLFGVAIYPRNLMANSAKAIVGLPPDFLYTLLASANPMRLSLMKAAHAVVGGAPCRKSGCVGRKRWAQPQRSLLLGHQIPGVDRYPE